MDDSLLQRISELRDCSVALQSTDAYFTVDDTKLTDPRRKFFVDIERELLALDETAWRVLKAEAMPLLAARDPVRGWQPLLDKLNEAKGYIYLARIGCANIRFIPRSKVRGVETPDLQGDLGSGRALCEVKTINLSDVEHSRRRDRRVGTTLPHLEQPFFNKVSSTIDKASSQLHAFSDQDAVHRAVLIVVNFDDTLHEYGEEYRAQIERYLRSLNSDVHVELDIKPPFYWCM